MNEERKLQVELEVSKLYDDLEDSGFGFPQLPINITVLLKKYGIEAFDTSFVREDIAGAFIRKDKLILLNVNDNKKRKIFTTAHELGHYFLHRHKDEEVLFRDGDDSPEEYEANYFAAKLLMPGKAVKHYWQFTQNIEQLANIFFVSRSSMLFRLKNLNLIG